MTATTKDGEAGENTITTATRRVALSVMPVTHFGKYNLIGKLGHGGMAEVYLAFVAGPAGFKKLVVIKRLHQHLEEEPGFLDMFLDEARLAARLNHPNVVQTHEVGEVDGSHFIAMEYLEGQGLDRIRRHCARENKTFPAHLTARIASQALEGLHYAHTLKDFDGTPLGVVHRDVSPQNVFVTYEGLVKLLDFGIAKAATHVVETRTGVVKGKFAYIAPEQARGRPIDRRADLWSMGVVLWETLAGRRLFKGSNDLATLSETLMGNIPALEDVAKDIPEPLVRIVKKALTRDRDQRFQDALEMKNALEEYLSKETQPCQRSDVGVVVKDMFADVIEQHRKVLQVCLSDSPEQIAASGAYRMDMTPSGVRAHGSGVSSVTPGSYPGTPPSGMMVTPSGASGSYAGPVPPQKSGWVGRVGFLLAAVVLAMLSTCVVLRFYNPMREGGGTSASSGGGTSPGDRVAEAPTTPATPEPDPAALLPPPPPPAPTETPGAGATPGSGQPEARGDAGAAPTPEPPGTGPSGDGPPAVAGGAPGASPSEPSPPSGGRGPRVVRPPRPPRTDRPTKTGGGGGGEVGTSPEPTKTTEPEPPPPAPRPDEEEFGFLTLDTVPWSRVSLGGRVLGTTPLIRIRLPAGTHNLSLVNPEAGIRTTYRIVINPGETTARRLGLQ